MANFGWAYVNCIDEDGAGQAAGPTGSIQFLTGANSTSGSAYLVYHTSSVYSYAPSTMVLSGNLIVTGAVSASVFHYRNVTVIDATGSTSFGDSADDVHMRVGSLVGKASTGASDPYVSGCAHTNRLYISSTQYKYRSVTTTPYTLTDNSRMFGIKLTTATEFRLLSASTVGSGHTIVIKDEVLSRTGAGNNITITGSPGSDILIDGSGEYILTGTMPAISLYSNGTNWFVF